uniref:Putative ovule protein n=1 Tax=Solanum chacoense TaxID=4108 RepID=A0A0V0GKP3_SOLCH
MEIKETADSRKTILQQNNIITNYSIQHIRNKSNATYLNGRQFSTLLPIGMDTFLPIILLC